MDFQETGTRAPLNQKPRKLLRPVPPGSPTLATRNRRKTIQAEKMKKEKTKYKIKKKKKNQQRMQHYVKSDQGANLVF